MVSILLNDRTLHLKKFLLKRALGVIFYEIITHKLPFDIYEDMSNIKIPKLPQNYEEYNNLLSR